MPGDKKDNNDSEEPESNPRWIYYLAIIVLSFFNFLNVAEVEDLHAFNGSLLFGAFTFAIAVIIFLLDQFGLFREKFDYMKALDGKVEGCTLLFFVLWWASGVGYLTHVNNVAYQALNIYFSSWGNLFVCVAALNKWSGSKEILTIEEITHISPTLKGWWAFFCASIVELGSAAASWSYMIKVNKDWAAFAVAVGAVTTVVSFIFILAHYKMVDCCKITHGGTLELIVSIVMNIYMFAGLVVLTKEGSVAATITGSGACTNGMPGSNLYLSLWCATIASFSVTVWWKESKTLEFARAAEKGLADEEKAQNQNDAISMKNEDDDDDDDSDEDAI